MAKVTVAPVSLAYNTGKAVDIEDMTTDHAEVACNDAKRLVLHVQNEDSSDACTITIKDGAEYSDQVYGDLEVSIPASGQKWIGPFESARFKDANDKIQIETSSTGTLDGKIQAILLP